MKVVLCLALAISCALAVDVYTLSDDFIDEINSKQSTWTAGRNFQPDISPAFLKGLLGTIITDTKTLPIKEHQIDARATIPESFDARETWSNCASVIGEIRDQAACGSCWAFGAVEAMSDRICIHSEGKKQVSVSAEDLNDCCGSSCGYGCNGGYLEAAWSYWKTHGLVTGGAYHTTTGCKAYSLVPCAHHIDDSVRQACGAITGTPSCVRSCDAGSSLNYQTDLTFGETVYNVKNNVEQIQTEIMTHGPVEASYTVYEDFLSYKSGVYQHVSGKAEGGHAVKILGWGVENGTPYWLVANSWNSDWGDKGYFKIIRGKNHLGIEAGIVAGIPKM